MESKSEILEKLKSLEEAYWLASDKFIFERKVSQSSSAEKISNSLIYAQAGMKIAERELRAFKKKIKDGDLLPRAYKNWPIVFREKDNSLQANILFLDLTSSFGQKFVTDNPKYFSDKKVVAVPVPLFSLRLLGLFQAAKLEKTPTKALVTDRGFLRTIEQLEIPLITLKLADLDLGPRAVARLSSGDTVSHGGRKFIFVARVYQRYRFVSENDVIL